MKISYNSLRILMLILCGSSLSGCLPFVVGGAATNTIVMAGSDRSLKGIKSDVSIWTSIKNQYIQYSSKDLFQRVSVRVMDSRVMLTGSVRDHKTKNLAERIAWVPNGVREVVNEIKVDGCTSIKSYASDKSIKAQINARLAFETGIKTGNYKIDVQSGIVYVIGATKSQDELNRALELISMVSGVKKVVNYVTLKR